MGRGGGLGPNRSPGVAGVRGLQSRHLPGGPRGREGWPGPAEAGGSARTSLEAEAPRGPGLWGPRDRDIYLQELSGPDSKYPRRISCASGVMSGELLSGDTPGTLARGGHASVRAQPAGNRSQPHCPQGRTYYLAGPRRPQGRRETPKSSPLCSSCFI